MQIEILRDRRIFVYFHLNKGGNGIRSPPNLKFELKIKFQIQEDKTVKHAPKKVFILENGKYKEITYSELQKLEQSDKYYTEKFERFGTTESVAKTSRENNDTCVQSQVER